MTAEGTPGGSDPQAHNCAGLRRDGTPCTATVQGSQRYCWHHSPELAEQRRANASTAAKSKSKPPLIVQVQDEIRDTINQVKRGELQTNRAQVMFTGYGVLVRALEQGRRQRQVEELEVLLEDSHAEIERLKTAQGNSWGDSLRGV